MYHQIHTYTELQQQIHDDLRIQHPEWVKSNGECPTCDSYESRLTEMLGALTRTIPNATRSNDHGHIYLRNSDSPFSCYYSRSLVL